MKNQATLKARPKLFLSYAEPDRAFAREVIRALQGLGTETSSFSSIGSGDDYNNDIRRAIQDSDAIIVPLRQISSRSKLADNVIFEIGAGVGAGRAIYVVTPKANKQLPFNVPQLRIVTPHALNEIVRELEAV